MHGNSARLQFRGGGTAFLRCAFRGVARQQGRIATSHRPLESARRPRVSLDPIPRSSPRVARLVSLSRRSSSGALRRDSSHAPRRATLTYHPRRPRAGRRAERRHERPFFLKRPHLRPTRGDEKRQAGRKGPNSLNHNELFTTGAANDGSSRPPDERTSSRSGTNPYADLKRIVKKNGLLDRQPAYYAAKTAFTLGLLAVSLALLFALGNTWFQLLNAVYLAFVFVQISLLAHDFGHRQFSSLPLEEHWPTSCTATSARLTARGSTITRHHAHPNNDVDPALTSRCLPSRRTGLRTRPTRSSSVPLY